MWAEVGRYVPTVGPYGAVIILMIPIIAVLATVAIVLLVSKGQIPEGDIRIRILGIKVRWGQHEGQNSKREDISRAIAREEERKEHRLRVVDPDK